MHKVHNAFSTGLNAFGSDMELLVIDVYYFKHAVWSSNFKEHQKDLGIPEHVFLQHVNNQWLTFLDSLERVLEQYNVLKAYFRSEAEVQPSGAVLRNRLVTALLDKKTKAKMLFLRSTAERFIAFQAIFQRQEPLIHIVYQECVIFASESRKYPLLLVLVRALLALPHGNADCEHGLSENKRIVDTRSSLGIATINGIRQVKSYMKRFSSDPCSVPCTRDFVKAVKCSDNVYSRRLQRESEEQKREKRKMSVEIQPIAEKRMKLCEEKRDH